MPSKRRCCWGMVLALAMLILIQCFAYLTLALVCAGLLAVRFALGSTWMWCLFTLWIMGIAALAFLGLREFKWIGESLLGADE